jgi:hypothetical protein
MTDKIAVGFDEEQPEPYFLVGDTWMTLSKLIEGYQRLEKLYVDEQNKVYAVDNARSRARMLASLEAERRAKAEAFVNYYKRTPAYKLHQWVLRVKGTLRGWGWRVRDAWEVLRGRSID